MTEMPTIVSERVDDIPLLLAQMRRMDLPTLVDSYFLTHGNRHGLSLGWTVTVWLAHVLSQADHRLNQVQPWAARRLETLRASSGQPLQELDLTDDRLADVLRTLADDAAWIAFERPLYRPAIDQVRSTLQQRGLLYVGDCKMGALQTRAAVQAQGDYYLCPLAATQVPPETLEQYLREAWAGDQPPVRIERTRPDGTVEHLADAYERLETLSTVLDGWRDVTWTERRLLVRSVAQARVAEAALRARVARAQHALNALAVVRRGQRRLSSREEAQQAAEAVLTRDRVPGLLRVHITEQVQTRVVRAYGARAARLATRRTVTLTAEVDVPAVEDAVASLGWRLYATNQPAAVLSLPQAVLAYRDEYIVERGFGRLKGRPLSLTPLYLERDDHVTGLLRLLTLALRVLTLVEYTVRQRLAQQRPLAGLYVGNPKRVTAQPTAERLLEAFREITLTVLVTPQQTQRHLTPLTPLQQQILALLGFSSAVYHNIAPYSPQPP